MLASTAETVDEAVRGFERASVEWKLDGIRIQAHRRDDEVRIYTRNLNEVTAALPGIAEAARALPVRSAVVDGEAIWMGADGPAAFQDTVSQIDKRCAARGRGDLSSTLCTWTAMTCWTSRSSGAPRCSTTSRPTCASRGSSVRPRRGGAVARRRRWPRATRAYREGHSVAVCRGPPRQGVAEGQACSHVRPRRPRRGVGSRSPARPAIEPPPGRATRTLGSVRHGRQDLQGLTDELLAWQTDALLTLERERRGIAVLVRPELVVEIALDGIQASTRYPGGVASASRA